jgi:hypothetical protein
MQFIVHAHAEALGHVDETHLTHAGLQLLYSFAHDLIRKPVPTFRDHALRSITCRPA